MKKFGVFMAIFMVLAFASFAESPVTVASDSTYVADYNFDSGELGLTLNPNVSASASLGFFTLTSMVDSSLDAFAMEMDSLTFTENLDFVFGPFEFYVEPTLAFDGDFVHTLTFPSELIISKIVPFTTFTFDYDLMDLINLRGPISLTANVVF